MYDGCFLGKKPLLSQLVADSKLELAREEVLVTTFYSEIHFCLEIFVKALCLNNLLKMYLHVEIKQKYRLT